MSLYYRDRWTGLIASGYEVLDLLQRDVLPRSLVLRRYRRLPERCCRLLREAAQVACAASELYRTGDDF
jgi:hypothetical protein